MARLAALAAGACLLAGCAGAGAGSLRYELAEGKVPGAFVETPFWKETAPGIGPDLDRRAALAKMRLFERQPLPKEELERLLRQGLPILLALGRAGGSSRRYVVLLGHDKERDLWIIHDDRRPDRIVSGGWLRRRWAEGGQWALVAIPSADPSWDPRGASAWRLRRPAVLEAGPVTQE